MLRVGGVALIVRLLMIAWSLSGLYSQPPSGMSDLYFRQGYAIAAGLGFVVGEDEANVFLKDVHRRVDEEGLVATRSSIGAVPAGIVPDSLHPPGMSVLVAGVHRALGVSADLPVQLLGAILDSLAAALVFWIGVTVATPRAGLVAGMLYALFLPQAWAATGAQMPDGLIGPFVVAMLAAYLKAGSANGAARYGWFALAGLALGIGSYLRPDYLLVPVGMFPFLWMNLRRFMPAAAGSIVVLGVAFMTLAPWAYRNHVIFDRWIFTSSGAGATMVTGLAEFHNPWGFGVSDNDRVAEARAAGFESAWVPAADAYFRARWLEAVREHPEAFVSAILKRTPLALAPPFEVGFANPMKTRTFTDARADGKDRYQALASDPLYVLRAYWDSLLMAAFSGVVLLVALAWPLVDRVRWSLALLVLSPHLYSIGSHLIVHLEPRFLLPSFFCLLIGFSAVATRYRRQSAGRRLVSEPA
jgi:hypothetical protein